MLTIDYGRVATARESKRELKTLFLEVEEYFDAGATLSRGAIVVDVGANIGAFAIAAGKRCDGELRAFCFEPVPALFAALERNLRDNESLSHGAHHAFRLALSSPQRAGTQCEFNYFRHFPRDSTLDLAHKRLEFEAFFAAQGARAGRATHWLGHGATLIERAVRSLPTGQLGQWFSDQVTGLERIQVSTATLSQALSEAHLARVDLLKLDVEGAELDVLAGIDAVWWGRIQQVVIESNGAEAITRSLLDLLQAQGFLPARVVTSPLMIARGLKNVLIYACRSQ
jgi:FkbM family methyltransferase